MRKPANQLSIAVVAMILGLLLVIQFRSQSAGTGLEAQSAQDLTVLVANLNTRNDQLRAEVATTEGELADLQSARSRGESSADQLRLDLSRVRAWAGLDAVTGSGIRVTVTGSIAGSAVEDLLNELQNAGAEALAVSNVRVVPGTVVAGNPGALSVENTALDDPFEVTALGDPAETLTGSLTRAGRRYVSQLAATFPDAQITVLPMDLVAIPATARDLIPAHGTAEKALIPSRPMIIVRRVARQRPDRSRSRLPAGPAPSVADRGPITFRLGDVIRLRRTHPCGGSTWLVDRLGADLGLRCTTCDRHVLVARRAGRAAPRRVRRAWRRGPQRGPPDRAGRRAMTRRKTAAATDPEVEPVAVRTTAQTVLVPAEPRIVGPTTTPSPSTRVVRSRSSETGTSCCCGSPRWPPRSAGTWSSSG